MQALTSTLDLAGYTTEGVSSATAALALLHGAVARPETAFDILLTDLKLTGMNGIELVRSAQGVDPDLVAVVMTGHGAIETAVQAMQCGAFEYILKPFNLAAVRSVLSRAEAVRRLRLQNSALAQRVKERTREIANRELRATNQDLLRLTRIISRYERTGLAGREQRPPKHPLLRVAGFRRFAATVIGQQEADKVRYLICDNGSDTQFAAQSSAVLEDRVDTFPGATLDVWFAYRIIERHGGRVTYGPLVDHRCCVNVQLPL